MQGSMSSRWGGRRSVAATPDRFPAELHAGRAALSRSHELFLRPDPDNVYLQHK